jgi:hypothetical protein
VHYDYLARAAAPLAMLARRSTRGESAAERRRLGEGLRWNCVLRTEPGDEGGACRDDGGDSVDGAGFWGATTLKAGDSGRELDRALLVLADDRVDERKGERENEERETCVFLREGDGSPDCSVEPLAVTNSTTSLISLVMQA